MDRAFTRADGRNEQKFRFHRKEKKSRPAWQYNSGCRGTVRIYRSVRLEASPASADVYGMDDGVHKMRKSHLIAVALAVAFMGYAGLARAQNIVGSVHDLTGVVGENDQVCAYCHTPHGGSTTGAPLWNRNDSALTFTMYSSSTLDGTVQAQPAGVSAACLSCHDGSTGFDSVINAPSGDPQKTGNNVGTVNANANFGTDLANDHPISITYGVDVALNAAAAGKVGALPLYGPTATKDQVECGSCHNPHDNVTFPKFLRMTTAASALCTTCHAK